LRLLFSGQTGEAEAVQPYATILFQLRIPHAVLMMLVGASLAGSGAAYQGCSATHWQTHTSLVWLPGEVWVRLPP